VKNQSTLIIIGTEQQDETHPKNTNVTTSPAISSTLPREVQNGDFSIRPIFNDF